MPNWCTTNMTIRGPKAEIARMLTFMQGQRGEEAHNPFDFNRLIPMPEELGQTVKGSHQAHGLAILDANSSERDYRNALAYLAHSDPAFAQPGGDGQAFLERHRAQELLRASTHETVRECLHQAELSLQARQKYGVNDWYEWSVSNWGTKWNSCEARVDEPMVLGDEASVSIVFDTAWSFPLPVMQKFAEVFDKLTFDLCADEEGGFFYLDGHGEGGRLEITEFEGVRQGGPYDRSEDEDEDNATPEEASAEG